MLTNALTNWDQNWSQWHKNELLFQQKLFFEEQTTLHVKSNVNVQNKLQTFPKQQHLTVNVVSMATRTALITNSRVFPRSLSSSIIKGDTSLKLQSTTRELIFLNKRLGKAFRSKWNTHGAIGENKSIETWGKDLTGHKVQQSCPWLNK